MSTRIDNSHNPDISDSEESNRSWAGKLFSARVFNIGVATAMLLIMALPVGLATIYLGFVRGESPCTLCGYERFGMVIVAVVAMLILRYGPHRKYIVTLNLAAFFFIYATYRHWGGHSTREVRQGFAEAVFGVHTYTWGVFVFWMVIAAAGIALLWIGRNPELSADFTAPKPTMKPLSGYSTVAGVVALAMIGLNSVQFFFVNGPPPFTGVGTPPRFTLDITQAAQNWTPNIWTRIKIPTLHSFSPDMVHIPGVHTDDNIPASPASAAPIPTSGTLDILSTTELRFDAVGPFGGRAGGIAYDSENDTFGIVSTGGGLYYVEEDFSTVVSGAVMDTVNGYDISHTADAMFTGPNTLVGMAWNKTLYGTERVAPGTMDDFAEWKEYRQTTGDLTPAWEIGDRPMLRTGRANQAYALSVAMDRESGLYSTVTVPAPNVPEMVVTQFGADDLLQRENVIQAAEDVAQGAETDLTGYYPVGADIDGGTMYLLSKTYQSLLLVEMETVTVTDAYELPEVGDYHGVAIANDSLYVLSDVDGADTVFQVSMP